MDTNGRTSCWNAGENKVDHRPITQQKYADALDFKDTEGPYRDLAVGFEHSCAIRTDGRLVCIGMDNYGQATPPVGTFQAVSVDGANTCGLKTSGELVCWGYDHDGYTAPFSVELQAPLTGKFKSLSRNFSLGGCAVRTNGQVACWGLPRYRYRSSPEQSFLMVSSAVGGSYHVCGVLTNSTISCWGNGALVDAAPDGEFRTVSTGSDHACGVGTDGRVVCWGNDDRVKGTPSVNNFTEVDAGWHETCAVRTDGSVVCW